MYSKARLACYSRYLLNSYFCIPVPEDEKDICFFVCLFVFILESLIGLPKIIQFHVFGITGSGIDLDCYDVEWVGLESS